VPPARPEEGNRVLEGSCFIYLDPDYAGQDTNRHPWLASRQP
jgi:hypothetical protein